MKTTLVTSLSICLIFFYAILTLSCSENPTGSDIIEPVAEFSWSGETVTPAHISFNNESENADSYFWDFDDGRSSIQQNPTIIYEHSGSYTVILEAENETSGKKDSYQRTIVITPGKVRLQQIVIEEFPFTTSTGAGWDLWNGPDLFIRFFDPSSNLIMQSTTAVNLVESDLPIGLNLNNPYEFDYWNSSYSLTLYDEDDISTNEYIGSVSFSINSIISSYGHAETVTLRSTDYSIRIKLQLDWE
jgi:PKD repeat protein